MQRSAKSERGDKLISCEGIVNDCPICHTKINPQEISSFLNKDNFEIIYRCNNMECGHFIIGRYEKKNVNGNQIYSLESIVPRVLKGESFPDEIQRISKQFVSIYNEALSVESLGYSEIAGIAYRKSLEFLIKDYLISKLPEEEAKIKSTFLGKVIDEMIEDRRIKECAKRAVWLGNDESHYVRKWEDKDINDLKILLKLTVNWIHNEKLTEEYINGMN